MADLYNDNPFQQIGDDSYIYGTPLDPEGRTFLELKDGKGVKKDLCVTNYDPEKGTITFAPKRNANEYDKNFVETVTIDEFAKRYHPSTAAPKASDSINVYGVSVKALDKNDKGYNTVFGNEVDLNKPNNIMFLPDGKEYSIKNIENGEITFAPVEEGFLGAKNIKNDETMTMSIEDFSKAYNPVGKDSQGNTTVFGERAEAGVVTTDGNGNTYVVQSVDGDKVTLLQAVQGDDGKVTSLGRTVEISPEGYVDKGTKASTTTSDSGKAGETAGSTGTDAGKKTTTTGADAGNAATGSTDAAGANTGATGTDAGKKDLQAESIAAREAEEAKAAQLQKDKDNLSKVEAEIKAENEAAKKAVEDKLKTDDPAMKDGSEEEKKVLEANQNERTSKDDNYKEVTKSAVDNSHTTTSEGTGSIDRGKVGNQDVAKEDFVGLNGRTYKKGEHIANDYAQTVTDNYTITTSDGKTKTSSYLPYDMVLADPKNFANTELLKKIYLDNIENNYLGDAVNFEDGISELEFKAIFDSTGKYTAKDLTETAKAIREDLKYDPFTKQARVSFSKTKVSDEWKKIKAVTDGANKKKDELRKRVEDLQEKFKKIHGMLEGMKGEAIEKGCLHSLDTIMGRYDVNMAQINDRLEPAICAIDLLYGNPTEAKDVSVHFSHIPMPLPFTGMKDINDSMPLSERMDFVDKKINNMLGTGDTPEDPNIKKLDEDIKNIDAQISSAQSAINAARAAAKKAEEEKKNGTWVQKASATITTTVANVVDTAAAASRLASLQEQKKALEKKKEELADEIKKLEEEYEKADNIAQELMELIDNFDLNTRSFREALAPSPDNTTFNWIIADDKDRLRLLMEQKDNIITDFTDYNKYRQITNLSDYEPDDVLIYDSSHPLAYVVTEGFDPRKGTIKIACVDTKTGKRIGSDITVWDQREIAPIRGLRDMKDWHEYDDIPDKLPEPEPEKPKKPGGGGGGGGETPKTTSPQTTSPQTTSPQTTSPQTTSPQTTSPQEIPPIPVYPVPGPGGDDYPGYNGPNAPHTGLDAIYGTGDTKQSAAGLGALAGLAAGAAGLGLTGLIGDKKDEDEDDEKESKAFKSEEVKPEEKKEPVVTDTTTNTENTTSTTNPQFF